MRSHHNQRNSCYQRHGDNRHGVVHAILFEGCEWIGIIDSEVDRYDQETELAPDEGDLSDES